MEKPIVPFTEDHFLKFRIPLHSNDWHKFRTIGLNVPNVGFYGGGIGASEAAKLIIDEATGLPINPYSPTPAELFEHKVGRERPAEFMNEAIFWGQVDEPVIRNIARFYDGTPDGYTQHFMKWKNAALEDKHKHIQREVIAAPYYLINTKYPQLFVSLDALITPGSPNFITGEILEGYAPLEIKTIGEYSAKEYESGVPAYHVIQLHQQMMVTESEYGEIILKKSGQKLLVRCYQRNEELCEIIDRVTRDFWFQRVIPARTMLATAMEAKKAGRESEYAYLMEEIDKLQPGPDASDAYTKWATDRLVRTRDSVQGDDNHRELIRKYVLYREYINLLKHRQTQLKNEAIKACSDFRAGEISFEDKYGHIRMGKNNRIYIGYNRKFPDEKIAFNIEKINLEIQGS